MSAQQQGGVVEQLLLRCQPPLVLTILLTCLPLTYQGKFAEAEPLYRRATEIWETASGPEHPNVATALNNRAGLLESQVRTVANFQELPYCRR